MATRPKVLTELSVADKEHALAVLAKGTIETFKGLDIVPPRFAVIVEHDGVPLIVSNILGNTELVSYCRMIVESLLKGTKVAPVIVPTRMTLREAFLHTMRQVRGTATMPEDSLAEMARVYATGFLDAVIQFGGWRSAKAVAREFEFMTPGWTPGPDWHYWNQPMQTR